MAEDWLADVRKYVADADETVVAKIVSYLGIALRKRDSSLVSFSDKKETDRVRENFLKKKLALTHDDAALDAAIAGVGEQMKGDRTKNRVTVYYLLARHFDLLTVFGGAAGSGGGAAIAGAAGAAAAVGLAGTPASKDGGGSVDTNGGAKAGDADDGKPGSAAPLAAAGLAGGAVASAPAAAAAPAPAAAAPPEPIAAAAVPPAPPAAPPVPPAPPAAAPAAQTAYSSGDGDKDGGGMGWLPWVLLALLVLALLFFGLRYCSKQEAAVASAGGDTAISETVAPADDAAAAGTTPAPAAAVPSGAGVVAAEREGKPMLTVYFDSGKSLVSNDLAAAGASLKAYIDSNPGAALAVSGYNDPTGNAAVNAELSKNRAQSVKAALEKLGIAADKVVLEKPAEATTSGADNAAARRVEVTVKN